MRKEGSCRCNSSVKNDDSETVAVAVGGSAAAVSTDKTKAARRESHNPAESRSRLNDTGRPDACFSCCERPALPWR